MNELFPYGIWENSSPQLAVAMENSDGDHRQLVSTWEIGYGLRNDKNNMYMHKNKIFHAKTYVYVFTAKTMWWQNQPTQERK